MKTLAGTHAYVNDLTSLLASYEAGTLDEQSTLDLFQWLYDTGLAWQLQGLYGREAHRLLNANLIQRRVL